MLQLGLLLCLAVNKAWRTALDLECAGIQSIHYQTLSYISTSDAPFSEALNPRQSILSQLLITRVSFNPVYSPPHAAVWYMLLFPAIQQAAAGFFFFFLFNIPQRQEPSTNYRILATSCKVQKAVLWKIPLSVFFFFFHSSPSVNRWRGLICRFFVHVW